MLCDLDAAGMVLSNVGEDITRELHSNTNGSNNRYARSSRSRGQSGSSGYYAPEVAGGSCHKKNVRLIVVRSISGCGPSDPSSSSCVQVEICFLWT